MQNIQNNLLNFDEKAISWARRVAVPMARFGIFLVYFWFGILKILGLSPASPLVIALLGKTMPSVAPDTFLIGFGVIEIVIAFLFVIPRLQRLALFALVLHLITTTLPLFVLPAFVWTGFLTPTLEGQYILKNILLIAAGITILASLKPYKESNV